MFAEIRQACALVADRARFVRLEPSTLDAYAESLLGDALTPRYDAEHHLTGDPEAVLAFNLTLDAVNFGSGSFPHLHKRPGMSSTLR